MPVGPRHAERKSIHFLLGSQAPLSPTLFPANADVIKISQFIEPIYRKKTKSSFLHTEADEVMSMWTEQSIHVLGIYQIVQAV